MNAPLIHLATQAQWMLTPGYLQVSAPATGVFDLKVNIKWDIYTCDD